MRVEVLFKLIKVVLTCSLLDKVGTTSIASWTAVYT